MDAGFAGPSWLWDMIQLEMADNPRITSWRESNLVLKWAEGRYLSYDEFEFKYVGRELDMRSTWEIANPLPSGKKYLSPVFLFQQGFWGEAHIFLELTMGHDYLGYIQPIDEWGIEMADWVSE